MKLQSIQVIRAIACLAIVVYHLSGLGITYTNSLYFDPASSVLKLGVDMFFVVSGAVMILTTIGRFDQPGTAARFAVHRFARIYPPYWILSFILTALWFYSPGSINAQHGGVDFLTSYTLLPSKLLPIVPVAWSLSYELMFYLVFGLMVAALPAKRLPIALGIWATFVIVGTAILSIAPQEGVLAPFVTSPYVLEFIAGCGVGLLLGAGRMFAPRLCVAASLVAAAATTTIFHVYAVPDTIPTSWHVAVFGPLSVLLVYGTLGLEARGVIRTFPRWAVMIGDSSYSLYIVHVLVIHAVYRVFRAQMTASFSFGVVVLGATFFACLAVGYGYWRWVERPSSAFTRRLLERLFVRPELQTPAQVRSEYAVNKPS